MGIDVVRGNVGLRETTPPLAIEFPLSDPLLTLPSDSFEEAMRQIQIKPPCPAAIHIAHAHGVGWAVAAHRIRVKPCLNAAVFNIDRFLLGQVVLRCR
jgi:hypothetical protein